MDHVIIETAFAYPMSGIPHGCRIPRSLLEFDTVAVRLRRVESAPLAIVCRPHHWGKAISFELGNPNPAEIHYVADSGSLWRALRGPGERALTVADIPDFVSKWCRSFTDGKLDPRMGLPDTWDGIPSAKRHTAVAALISTTAKTRLDDPKWTGEPVGRRPLREILWEKRDERLAVAVAAAARDFLVIGKTVHVRTPGPSWDIDYGLGFLAQSDFVDGHGYAADERDLAARENGKKLKGVIDIVDMAAYRSAAPSQAAACILKAILLYSEPERLLRMPPEFQSEMARLKDLSAGDWYPSADLPWLEDASDSLGRIDVQPRPPLVPWSYGEVTTLIDRLRLIRARRPSPRIALRA